MVKGRMTQRDARRRKEEYNEMEEEDRKGEMKEEGVVKE